LPYYERHLPHWQPDGAALFVTWRLRGSLPKSVAFPGKQSPEGAFAAMDRELDMAATGPRWLQDERVAQRVVDALLYGERQLGLYRMRAWVLMVNHVHILIYPEVGLSRITKAIKNYSARQANAILGRTGQPFWQDESYDHWVRGPDESERIVHYIEGNPVTAGLVNRVEAWPWSSAFGDSAGQARRPVPRS
jgi:putative transposase